MKKLIAGILFLLTTAAHANDLPPLVQIKVAGVWTVSYSSGLVKLKPVFEPVCVMSTGDQAGQAFFIRYTREKGLFLQVKAPHWKLKVGDKTTFTVQLDRGAVLKFDAVAHKVLDADHYYLAANVPDDLIPNFLNPLKTGAKVIRIGFPDGDEPTWTGPLTGSAAAYRAFDGCAKDMQAAAESVERITPKTSPITPKASPVKPSTRKDDGTI